MTLTSERKQELIDRFGADQTRETTLALLAECFEELGGVPAVVLTDRMGCLKAGVVANVVVPHPEYVAFATRFGFKIDFCEAADPESKGMVENLCGYVQKDLLVPALLEPEWLTIEDGNVAARAWCTEFFDYYNHQHRHRNLGLHTPASVHHGTAPEIRAQRAITLTEAFHTNPSRFARRPHPPKLPTIAWINETTPEALIKSA